MQLMLLDNVVGFSGPLDFGQNTISRGGPNEGLGISVVDFHVLGLVASKSATLRKLFEVPSGRDPN